MEFGGLVSGRLNRNNRKFCKVSVSDRTLDYPDPIRLAFPETGEPIFRRSTMRLGFPRITSLQTDDGAASITFQSTSMDRDTGGYEYLFRFAAPSGETEVRATVARVTGAPAAKKFAAETGNSLWSLKIREAEEYVDKYAEEHGNIFEVRIFAVPPDTSGSDIVVLRDTFCRLFFECWSSYRYNNADETSDPAGRYPDTIDFRPYDVDRRLHATLRARQDENVQHPMMSGRVAIARRTTDGKPQDGDRCQ